MELYLYDIDLSEKNIRHLLPFAEREAIGTDIWKEYVIRRLCEQKNVFSETCARFGFCGKDLESFAMADIEALWETFDNKIVYHQTKQNKIDFADYAASFQKLLEAGSPAALLHLLIDHYHRFGVGETSKYIAFKWNSGLVGISQNDKITLDELIGLSYQKQSLIDNTAAFVSGKSANNVLLFGDSGCGKSSSVKALLNRYHTQGLRLVEFPINKLSELPLLFEQLKGETLKYIVFLDDLSFETDDIGYKYLKIAMDGQVECQPDNVLIYATSNRRHLLKMYWSERSGDEISTNDTKQEKTSLSERFGLQITFVAPTRQEYLQIVKGLAERRGIKYSPEIEKQAVAWEMQHASRSGRSAKQFVKQLQFAL